MDGGQRLERQHALLLGLADADQDPARERDRELAGFGHRAITGDFGERPIDTLPE